MIKFIKLNYIIIIKYSWAMFAALLAVCSLLQGLCIQGAVSVLLAEVILYIIALLVASFFVYRRKENTISIQQNTKIKIIYGDLLKIAFNESNNQNKKRIVVIPVNTCFDIIVDDNIALVKKPLVSPASIHGKWLKQVSKTMHIDEIDKRIAASLKDKVFSLIPLEQKSRGNHKDYPFGTVAIFDYASTEFFLLALSRFDSNNNAQCTKDEFLLAVKKMIDFIDKHGQGLPIYIPLMGSNLSRAKLTRKESLQAMVAMMKLYADRVPGEVNIVVYDGDRDKVSIYDVV